MELKSILDNFEPISLKEMDSVKLLDRTDTKFLFHSNRLFELLSHSQKHYKILQIDEERDFLYSTTYLDTDNFDLFIDHMRSRPNRSKVRYRTYESTGVSFLELKSKTNKKRTVKQRINNTLVNDEPDSSALEFLSSHLNGFSHKIKPVLVNKFRRLTLVGIETKERITIDYNLSFDCNGGSHVDLPYLSIAELKREGFTNRSPFLEILKEMQIRKSSFSKYCIGSALLRPMPKTNILKPILLKLNKIENDNNAYYNS